MGKVYLEKNVYEALQDRYEFIFSNFDVIEVSFSGGKDSTVLIHTIIDYMKRHEIQQKIILQYMDYEGSYQFTQDHIKSIFEMYHEYIYPHWNCLTYQTACGVSMFQDYWLPWDEDKKEIWVRDYPILNGMEVITNTNHPYDFYYKGIADSKFDLKFTDWCHHNYAMHLRVDEKKTVNLMGVRAEESLHRHNAIVKSKYNYKDQTYIINDKKNIYHAYPLYDWLLKDVWLYLIKFNKPYNKLYDLFFQAGVSPYKMRVASAFIDQGIFNLKLHRAIEPNTWARLVNRVNGVNFANIYGSTKVNGYRKITLPKHHTWKSYCEFLLDTLPDETRKMYEKKFTSTFNTWLVKGGTVHKDSLESIKASGYEFEVLGKPKGKKYKNDTPLVVVRFKVYPDNIEDKYFRKLPSYKRMCITILKNDTSCKYMGYAMTKYEKSLKQKALSKYKNIYGS